MRRHFLYLILSFVLGIWGGVILMNYLDQKPIVTSVDTIKISNFANYEQIIEIVTDKNDNYILLQSRENIIIKCNLSSDIEIYWIPLEYNEMDEIKTLLLRIGKEEVSKYCRTEKNNVYVECQKNE